MCKYYTRMWVKATYRFFYVNKLIKTQKCSLSCNKKIQLAFLYNLVPTAYDSQYTSWRHSIALLFSTTQIYKENQLNSFSLVQGHSLYGFFLRNKVYIETLYFTNVWQCCTNIDSAIVKLLFVRFWVETG